MHAARLGRSPRLDRVHELLSDGREYSTLEISLATRVLSVSAVISELRANGCEIGCRQIVDASGGRLWLYRMTPASRPFPRRGKGSDQPVIREAAA